MSKRIIVSEVTHQSLKVRAAQLGVPMGVLAEALLSAEAVPGRLVEPEPPPVGFMAEPPAPTMQTLRAKAYSGPFSKASQAGKK